VKANFPFGAQLSLLSLHLSLIFWIGLANRSFLTHQFFAPQPFSFTCNSYLPLLCAGNSRFFFLPTSPRMTSSGRSMAYAPLFWFVSIRFLLSFFPFRNSLSFRVWLRKLLPSTSSRRCCRPYKTWLTNSFLQCQSWARGGRLLLTLGASPSPNLVGGPPPQPTTNPANPFSSFSKVIPP